MKIDGFIDLSIFILCVSLFLGTILFINDQYFGPKLRRKKLKTLTFTDFYKIGFENRNDYLIGKIKGYSIVIGYYWENSDRIESVYTIVLFDPELNGKNLNSYFLNKWQTSIEDDYNHWEYGRFFTIWPYQNGGPNSKTVIRKIEKNIKIVSNKGLKKMEFEKWIGKMKKYNITINEREENSNFS